MPEGPLRRKNISDLCCVLLYFDQFEMYLQFMHCSWRKSWTFKALGIVVPKSPAPAANYVPWTKSGKVVFISGRCYDTLPLARGCSSH
eukprot:6160202-Amphidinium_carterae.1